MQETVKQDRDKYIGGSDIPVIMNLSPFKSRFDLLLEKAGYKEDTFDGNVYTEYGNKLEPKIRDYVNKYFGEADALVEGKHTREAQDGEIIGVRIHTDGENKACILEIKTTSQIHDDVEDYKIYLVQLLFYMVNTGKRNGILAVYNRPEDLSEEFNSKRLQIFNIKLEDYTELCSEISDACERFIEDLQKVKDNPFITEEELLPVEVKDIASQIVALESQLDYFKTVEKKSKDLKTKLKDAMQAAGVKSWTTPNGYKLTLIPDGEDKVETEEYFDEESVKRDLPDLFRSESDGGYMKTRKVVRRGRSGYVKITSPKGKKEDS